MAAYRNQIGDRVCFDGRLATVIEIDYEDAHLSHRVRLDRPFAIPPEARVLWDGETLWCADDELEEVRRYDGTADLFDDAALPEPKRDVLGVMLLIASVMILGLVIWWQS